jgi:hypothetical protein
MGASGTPILKTITADDVGVTMDFGQEVSAILLTNNGANDVFFAVGTVAPAASRGDGRYGLQAGKSIALSDLAIQTLTFICATGLTASVSGAGLPGVPPAQAAIGIGQPAAAPAAPAGFYVEWNGPVAASGPSPKTDIKVCNVPVNGATSAVATCPSGKVRFFGTFETYLQFDGGPAWQLANILILTWNGCFASLNVTEVSTPVDCTGKLNLTGIKCIVTEAGQNVTLSGLIHVVGTAEAKTLV